MSDLLERLLIELDSSTNNDSNNTNFNPPQIISNLTSIIFGEINLIDQEFVIELIIKSESPPSLLQYIKSTSLSKDNEIITAKKDICNFLATYIKLQGKKLLPYSYYIFNIIFETFDKESLNRDFQKHLLLPLKNILRLYKKYSYYDHNNFDLNKIYELFMNIIKSNTTKTAFPKGLMSELLRIIGLLIDTFPYHNATINNIDSIIHESLFLLNNNFFPIKLDKSPDFAVIAGVFSLLDKSLYDYSSIIFASKMLNKSKKGKDIRESIDVLWECILKAISSSNQGDVHRYETAGKALKLVAHHAELFQKVIGNNSFKSYEELSTSMKSKQSKIIKYCEDAYSNVLSQISNFVSINNKSEVVLINKDNNNQINENKSAISTLYFLCNTFMDVLANNSVNNDNNDIDLAVIGLAALAPGITSLESNVEISSSLLLLSSSNNNNKQALNCSHIIQLLVRTSISSNLLLQSSNVGDKDTNYRKLSSIIKNKSQFLYAISCVLNNSQVSVTEDIKLFITSSCEDILVSFTLVLTEKQKIRYCTSLTFILNSFAKRSNYLLTYFLESIIPSLLLRTVSRDSVVLQNWQVENNNGDELPPPLVARYLSLWIQIFLPRDLNNSTSDEYLFYLSNVSKPTLNQLYIQLERTLTALDLSYSKLDNNISIVPVVCEEYDSDVDDNNEIESNFTPSNLIDQDIMINIADFMERLLPLISISNNDLPTLAEYGIAWLPILVPTCIRLSKEFPMVSALYRVLQSLIRSLDSNNDSNSINISNDTNSIDLSNVSSSNSSSSNNNFDIIKMLKKFIQDLCTNLPYFQDELLCSALSMILKAPFSIVSIDSLVQSIILSLKTGLQANIAVDTLNRLITSSLKSNLMVHLDTILPVLDSYLLSSSTLSSIKKGTFSLSSSAIIKSKSSRVNSSANQGSYTSIDNEINIQTSILKFLGRLGGDNQQILYSQTSIKNSISWCNIDSIFINLPLLQLSNSQSNQNILYLTVVLDRLLPRIVELCSHASFATPAERQVCLLAAESLHSIIILMVGNSATSPNQGKIGWKSEFASIYNRVFPIVVSLSVCSDIVVSQLYSKLLFQLIHWFSASNQVHVDEADALVEALTQGLCIESDSSLRDQCSTAINEFFQWSIKQSTKKELAFNPASSEALLKRLFMLATQPSESHRLGASLAFSKLRTNFREQTSLVNYFSLSIVHVLLMSLRLGNTNTNYDGLEKNLSTCNQIIETIINYTEILFKSVHKRGDLAKLMEYSDKRVFPHSISELVKWLWDNISDSNKSFRSTCMKCFLKLVPLVINDNNDRNINHFSKEYQKDILNYISNLSNDNLSNDNQSNSYSNSNAIHVIVTTIEGADNVNRDIEGNFDNDYKEIEWLLQLNAMIDSYSWLIQSNIIDPTALFLSSASNNSDQINKKRKTNLIKPNIFRYINNFMIQISTNDHSNCNYRKEISKVLKDLRVNVVKLSILLIYSIMNYVDFKNVLNSNNVISNSDELLIQFGEYFRSNNVWCDVTFDVILKLLLWTRLDNIFPSSSDTNGLSLFACTKKLFYYIYYLDSRDSKNNKIVSFISTKTINCLNKLERIQYNIEEMNSLFRFILLIKSSNNTIENSQSLANHIFGDKSSIKKEINRISLNIIYKISNFPIETKPHQLAIGLKLLELAMNFLGTSVFILTISPADYESNQQQLINLSHINDLLYLDNGRAELFFSRYGDNLAKFLINIKEENLLKESLINLINLFKRGRNFNIHTDMIIDTTDDRASTNSIAKGLVLRLLSTSIAMLINNIRVSTKTITCVISSCLSTSNSNIIQVNNDPIPHELLLQLVKLDARLPLNERNKDIYILLKQDIVSYLNNCNNYSCEDICLRIKLIPYLIDGITKTCPRLLSHHPSVSNTDTEDLMNALEEVVAVKFPMKSADIDHTSVSGKEFNALLREYLSIISSCGSIALFEPLKITLKEGYNHKYSDLIITSLQNLVNGVDISLDFDKFNQIPPVSEEYKNIVSMSNDTIGSSSSLPTSFIAIISYVLLIIFDEKEKISIKTLLTDKLLIPLLNRCTSNVLVALFTSKSNLFNLINEDSFVKFLSIQMEIDPNIKTGDKKINFIFIQSCCFKLFQIMFDKCLKQSIENQIKFAFGGEINGKMIKNAYTSIRRIILVDESDDNNKLVQRLYSEIYSFLLIIVSKTQSKESNYDNFLFNDKNDNPFFIRAINCMKTYKFKAISGKFDSIYLGSSFNSNNVDNEVNSSSFSSNKDISGSKNLSSQYLQGSSLGECRTQSGCYYSSREEIDDIEALYDINKANLNKANLNSVASSRNIDKDIFNGDDNDDDDESGSSQYDVKNLTQQHYKTNNNEMEIDYSIYVQGFDDQLIELELNDLNKQTCMSSMIRTIQRMNVLFAKAWSLNFHVLPNWLFICHKHLSNSNANINLRLFILRLLLNQPIADIVKPYINILLESILDCCNNDLCNESNNNIGFHYFLRDIVNILNDTWNNARPNSTICEEKASLFLNNLIQRSYEADTSVLLDNCRSIADLISQWLGTNDSNKNNIFETTVNIQLDLAPIVSLLKTEAAPTGGAHASQSSKGSEGVRKRLAGIQLLGDILHAGYPLFNRSNNYSNGNDIYNALLDCVKFPRKEVCCNASKCCGYILHLTIPSDPNTIANANLIPGCQEFKAKLESVLESKQSVKDGIDSICSCLQGIVKEFPSFMSRSLLVRIIGRINSLKSRSKYEFLDALYITTTDFEDFSIPVKLCDHLHSLLSDLFTVVLGRGTDSKAKIPVIQLYTLKILTKYIKDIDVKVLELLIYGSEYDFESVATSGDMNGVLSLVIDERSIYQIRKEAFVFLLKLINTISNDDYFVGKNYDENRIKTMRKTLRILLLKGLSASYEGDGMDEVISDHKNETLPSTIPSSLSSSINISSEELNSLSNQSISAAIYSYFNDYYGLSKDPYQRIHILMTDLFDLNCASHWLNYTTYLLLSLSTSTNEFSLPLFNRNLTDECNFVPMQVNSNNLRNRKQFDRSQTPLFSFDEAIKRSSSQSQSQFRSQFGTASTWMGTFSIDKTQRDAGYLRDTQAMQWTQTQQEGDQTQGISLQFDGASTQSRSTLSSTQAGNFSVSGGFEIGMMGPPIGLPNYRKKLTSQKKTKRFVTNGSTNSSTQGTYQRSQTSSFSSSSSSYSSISSYENRQQKKILMEKNRRSDRVVLYRKYREGELPDICIPISDVIRPLHGLCLHDSTIASIMFQIVYEGLYKNNNDVYDNNTYQLRFDLSNLLNLSTSKSSNNTDLVRSILLTSIYSVRKDNEMMTNLLNKPIQKDNRSNSLSQSKVRNKNGTMIELLNPESIADVSIISLNFHTGIQLLEEQLLVLDKYKKISNETSHSKLSQSTMSDNSRSFIDLEHKETSLWVQLSRVYECLGENDIVLGLAIRTCSIPKAKQALDYEISNNYKDACRIYSELNDAFNQYKDDSDNEMEQDDDDRSDDKPSDFIKNASKEDQFMWNERNFECLRQLCDWNELYNKLDIVVSDITDNRADLLNVMLNNVQDKDKEKNKKIQSRLLPFYIQSLLHYDDRDKDKIEKQELLKNFINQLYQKKDNISSTRQYLEGRHSIDLATYFAFKQEWGRVSTYTDISYRNIIATYKSLHPCAIEARKNLLISLQRVLELDDASNSYKTGAIHRDTSTIIINELLSKWLSCPSDLDSPYVWDDIILGRSIILSPTVADTSSSDCKIDAANHLSKLLCKASRAAIQQGNMYSAKIRLNRSLELTKEAYRDTGQGKGLKSWEVCAVYDFNCKDIDMKEEDYTNCQDKFKKTIDIMEKFLSPKNSQNTTDFSRLKFQLMKAVWMSKWSRYNLTIGINTGDVSSADYIRGLEQANHCIELYGIISQQAKTFASSQMLTDQVLATNYLSTIYASSYSKMADYYDFLIDFNTTINNNNVTKSMSSTSSSIDKIDNLSLNKTDLVNLTLTSYLSGLRLGDSKCRNSIMRIVNLVGLYPNTAETVLSLIPSIPAWFFLHYSAQLMGTLDLPEGVVSIAILNHIARVYPSALFYNFKITNEFLGSVGKKRSEELHYLLKDNKLECFVEALNGLSHPELRWKDGIKIITNLLKNKTPHSEAEAKVVYQKLVQDVLSLEWSHVGDKIGIYNKKFAKQFGPKIMQLGFDFKEIIKFTNDNIASRGMKYSLGNAPLSEFSNWLNDFDFLKYRIEIPGQYNKDINKEPSQSSYAMIVTVDSSLLVLPSIRVPKRIKFYASGGQESMFLVKGGEDLRNDERIEQLFSLMNSIVQSSLDPLGSSSSLSNTNNSNNSNSIRCSLQARTFVVIPMSSCIGLLEWVANTVPIKQVISEELFLDQNFIHANPDNKNSYDYGKSKGKKVSSNAVDSVQSAGNSISNKSGSGVLVSTSSDPNVGHSVAMHLIEASVLFQKWIGTNDYKSYHKLFKNLNDKQANDMFQELHKSIPNDLIRRRLLKLSSSPEVFHSIRQEFSKSLAVSSIFGYLLGLGDRHLDNLLLDKLSGSLVQIDFGICFGLGSTMLPVPELMPFRLTAQLRSILQPLDETALLRQYMIQCLSSIRNNSSMLISALNIYVNDPVLEWTQTAMNKVGEYDSEISLQEFNQLKEIHSKDAARDRINGSIMKINGCNPIDILIKDISNNKHVNNEKSFKKLETLIENAGKGNRKLKINNFKQYKELNKKNPLNNNDIIDSTQIDESVIITNKTNQLPSSQGKSEVIIDVSSQVDILINLATDPALLVVQYSGLETWI